MVEVIDSRPSFAASMMKSAEITEFSASTSYGRGFLIMVQILHLVYFAGVVFVLLQVFLHTLSIFLRTLLLQKAINLYAKSAEGIPACQPLHLCSRAYL